MEVKKPRVPSPKQLAVLKYGQRLRGLGNVGELIKGLKELGCHIEAYAVEGAVQTLKARAIKEYETKRKALDPEWKTWSEQNKEEMDKFFNEVNKHE